MHLRDQQHFLHIFVIVEIRFFFHSNTEFGELYYIQLYFAHFFAYGPTCPSGGANRESVWWGNSSAAVWLRSGDCGLCLHGPLEEVLPPWSAGEHVEELMWGQIYDYLNVLCCISFSLMSRRQMTNRAMSSEPVKSRLLHRENLQTCRLEWNICLIEVTFYLNYLLGASGLYSIWFFTCLNILGLILFPAVGRMSPLETKVQGKINFLILCHFCRCAAPLHLCISVPGQSSLCDTLQRSQQSQKHIYFHSDCFT